MTHPQYALHVIDYYLHQACPNCNGTRKSVYFSEQAWRYEERVCHLCRGGKHVESLPDYDISTEQREGWAYPE